MSADCPARSRSTTALRPTPGGGRRALLAYTAYVGQSQLAARLPDLLPRERAEQERYLESTLAALLGG